MPGDFFRKRARIARVRVAATNARRIADALGETLDGDGTAVVLFESAGGWTIEIHGEAHDERALRDLVARCADPATAAALTFAAIAERDWVAASLARLAPVRAGRFVVHGAHDAARVAPNAIGIGIEAALAFGTGHHGTTRGCLLALDRMLKSRRPRRVLDVGTGSGVLAIAAAKVLRASVLASDIDAQAVRVARANASANRVGGLITLVHAPGVSDLRFRRRGPYDLVLANILSGPLQRLAHSITRHAAPKARIVLSGLLRSQASAIVAAYRAQNWRLARRIDLDEWTTLVLVRGAQ